MSDIQQQKELLFAKWTESELSDAEQQQFETWCQQDSDFASQVAVHGQLQFMASNYEAVEVPNWSAGDIFEKPRKTPWWQWKGLPAFSLATSMAAILMVTLQIEVTLSQGSVTLSFADTANEQRIEQLVTQRLAEYEQRQTAQFVQKSQQLQEQQQAMNTQLANYLLTASRTERREDFAELIKHVNQQRADDQVFYARQINHLKDNMTPTSGTPE